MNFDVDQILSIFDRCCDEYTFPMLDNGYVYLAADRLSLYRSKTDWAMVIEVFGFSLRSGSPDTAIYTFASRLHNRPPASTWGSREAYEQFLANNPHNDMRAIGPIQEGPWQDDKIGNLVAQNAKEIILRGQALPLPRLEHYGRHGIELEQPPRVQVFELCRYLADIERDAVLATSQERQESILPDMDQILQLEEWHHPNVVEDEDRPSGSD